MKLGKQRMNLLMKQKENESDLILRESMVLMAEASKSELIRE